MRFLLVCISIVFLSGEVHAQDTDTDWYTDEDGYVYETEVHGYRLQPTDEATAHAETIEVEPGGKSLKSVSETLGATQGVAVRQSGGLGSFGSINIRGSTSAQVPVVLDGINLNVGGFPTVNLGQLTLDLFSKIEIYRLNAPLDIGVNGIGGALVLTSKLLDETLAETSISYGSWQTARIYSLVGGKVGKSSLVGIVSTSRSTGNFIFFNNNGTNHNQDDDTYDHRTNNTHNDVSSLLKFDTRLGAWRLSALNNLYVIRQGVPGLSNLPAEHASYRSLRNATSLKLESPIDEKLRAIFQITYLNMRDDFADTEGEIGIGSQRSQGSAHSLGGSILVKWQPVLSHLLKLRLSGSWEKYKTRELVADYAPPASFRTQGNVGIEDEWRPIKALKIVPALKLFFEHSSFGGTVMPGSMLEIPADTRNEVFFSPSLGAKYDFPMGLTLRGNLGRYIRPADLSELYADRGSVVGNPSLVPEEGINADMGASYLLADSDPEIGLTSLRLDGAVFFNQSKNLITYVQNSQNTIRPENVDSARIFGAELGLRIELIQALSIVANYTYLYAINTSDSPTYNGKRLPGRPAHEAYARFEFKHRFPKWKLKLWLDGDYAGQNYLDQANLKQDLLARFLVGVGLQVEHPEEKLGITVTVSNLLDTIVLHDADGAPHPLRDFEGFPLPGRTIFTTLYWKY